MSARKHRTRPAVVDVRMRHEIIRVANAHRVDKGLVPKYSMRTLNQAVAAVRNRKLVKPAALLKAGFNPTRRR